MTHDCSRTGVFNAQLNKSRWRDKHAVPFYAAVKSPLFTPFKRCRLELLNLRGSTVLLLTWTLTFLLPLQERESYALIADGAHCEWKYFIQLLFLFRYKNSFIWLVEIQKQYFPKLTRAQSKSDMAIYSLSLVVGSFPLANIVSMPYTR